MNEYDYIIDCLKDLENITFFEVGAYNGVNTFGFINNLHKLKKTFKYYAFECDKRNIEKIKNNKALDVYRNDFELIEKAVYSKSGVSDFYESSGYLNESNEYDCCSSLMKPYKVNTVFPFIDFSLNKVETITLNEFCKNKGINKIDFLFVDIQGAEIEMMKAANEVNINYVFLEKSVDELYAGSLLEKEMINYMINKGFKVVKIFEHDILFKWR